jgi:hypothetical protein
MKFSISTIAFIVAALESGAVAQNAVSGCSSLEFINGIPVLWLPSRIGCYINFSPARGTGEPLMPKYGTIVGDPLFKAITKLIPDATGYSVNYAANSDPCSRELGEQDVVKHLREQSAKMPGSEVRVGRIFARGGRHSRRYGQDRQIIVSEDCGVDYVRRLWLDQIG